MYDFKTTKLPILKPLKNSFANGTIESEYRDLFLEVFSELLAERYFDVSVLGSAQLGSLNLVRKAINNDGLVMLEGDTEEVNTRRIYRAWMSRNNQGRGLHFLRAYLQLVFPNVCAVDQLWQKKSLAYPLFAICKRSDPQIDINTEDYFLTSRIEISLDPNVDSKNVQKIGAIVRSIIPARLVPNFRFYIVFDFSVQMFVEWFDKLFKDMEAGLPWYDLYIEPRLEDAWRLGLNEDIPNAPILEDHRVVFNTDLLKDLFLSFGFRSAVIEPDVKDAWLLGDDRYPDQAQQLTDARVSFTDWLQREPDFVTDFNSLFADSESKEIEQQCRLYDMYIEPTEANAWRLGLNENPSESPKLQDNLVTFGLDLSKGLSQQFNLFDYFIEPTVENAWLLGEDSNSTEAPKLQSGNVTFTTQVEYVEDVEAKLESEVETQITKDLDSTLEFSDILYIEPTEENAWYLGWDWWPEEAPLLKDKTEFETQVLSEIDQTLRLFDLYLESEESRAWKLGLDNEPYQAMAIQDKVSDFRMIKVPS